MDIKLLVGSGYTILVNGEPAEQTHEASIWRAESGEEFVLILDGDGPPRILRVHTMVAEHFQMEDEEAEG